MTFKRLGAADLVATTNTTIYTPAALTAAVVTLRTVNRSNTGVTMRAAISATATPTDSEWIEYGAYMDGNGGIIESSGLAVGTGQFLVVWASAAGVTATAYGSEK